MIRGKQFRLFATISTSETIGLLYFFPLSCGQIVDWCVSFTSFATVAILSNFFWMGFPVGKTLFLSILATFFPMLFIELFRSQSIAWLANKPIASLYRSAFHKFFDRFCCITMRASCLRCGWYRWLRCGWRMVSNITCSVPRAAPLFLSTKFSCNLLSSWRRNKCSSGEPCCFLSCTIRRLCRLDSFRMVCPIPYRIEDIACLTGIQIARFGFLVSFELFEWFGLTTFFAGAHFNHERLLIRRYGKCWALMNEAPNLREPVGSTQRRSIAYLRPQMRGRLGDWE